ncbi:hypothetical protein L3V77_11205 [Vibrio sp. DW001]|uniref:hypothetical protein n=1 Tax=Vibrio sp. DW001 TaxID=2912315 RepID=UPI0023B02F1E|nr:hypothetical protein [Vibrio sp. DW001]WED25631.1 hypothetical protein L3V77_11205 [Vibrio sp. DW001]
MFLCFVFFSVNASAVTITAEYKRDQIIWDTGMAYSSSLLTSSISEIYTNLAPTKRWIPGAAPQDATITLKGNDASGTTISVPIHISGFEYNWSGANFTVKNNSLLSSISMTECKNTTVSGNTIAVYSASPNSGECIGNQHLQHNSVGQTPFFFVKPIFSLKDESALKVALKAATSVGNFTGSTNVTFRYYYYRGEILTYRVLTMPISLQFNITKIDFIDSVDIRNIGPFLPSNSLNGVIEPLYDKSTQTVKGKPTEFEVTVKGNFMTGINMTFKPEGGGYYLKHEDYVNNSATIKYDIKCDQYCSKQEIVTDGRAINVNDVPVPISMQQTANEIVYKIRVGYDKAQQFDDVHTGRYSGSFTIEFGLGI